MAANDKVAFVKHGWVQKYSRYQQLLRKRYAVLIHYQDVIKRLRTFKNEEDAEILSRATETIDISLWTNIEPYYGKLNVNNDELHFSVNNCKFIFKCDSKKTRDSWIYFTFMYYDLNKCILSVENFNATGSEKQITVTKKKGKFNDSCNTRDTKIIMKDVHNIQEYFGHLNSNNDCKHFMINDKFIFKCKNEQDCLNWIEIITQTNNYDVEYTVSSAGVIDADNNANDNDKNVNDHDYQDGKIKNDNDDGKISNNVEIQVIKHKNRREEDHHHLCIENGISNDNVSLNVSSNNGGRDDVGEFEEKKEQLLQADNAHGNIINELYLKSNQLEPIKMVDNDGNDDGDDPKILLNSTTDTENKEELKENRVESSRLTGVCDKGLRCPVYLSIKHNVTSECDELSYNHMVYFNHFLNGDRPVCTYGDECLIFKRMENNEAITLNDKCHFLIFKHPARHDREPLNYDNKDYASYQVINNTHQLANRKLLNKETSQSCLKKLIFELVENDFKQDLCLNIKKNTITSKKNDNNNKNNNVNNHKNSKTNNDTIKNGKNIKLQNTNNDCHLSSNEKNDFLNNHYSILKFVNDRMDSIEHKRLGSPLNRAEMLSLVLYTSGDCNYDLSKEQRKNNYKKWKYFDSLLMQAIVKLNKYSKNDLNNKKIYCGLHNVKMQQNIIKNCWFPTYVSASWDKNVSIDFIDKNGMLIEFDKNSANRLICCKVDWISRFPDECEILIARTEYYLAKYGQLKRGKELNRFDMFVIGDQDIDNENDHKIADACVGLNEKNKHDDDSKENMVVNVEHVIDSVKNEDAVVKSDGSGRHLQPKLMQIVGLKPLIDNNHIKTVRKFNMKEYTLCMMHGALLDYELI